MRLTVEFDKVLLGYETEASRTYLIRIIRVSVLYKVKTL
jgi:hypothetical protein